MAEQSTSDLLAQIQELQDRLEEAEQLINAIREGEVDAFAIQNKNQSEIYALQSVDYVYRLLIEEFREGAVNVTEDGLIVYVDTYFSGLLELPYEKIIGSSIFDFIHPDSQQEFASLLDQSLSGSSKGEINLLANDRIVPV